MYMGVILSLSENFDTSTRAPHVYGGDPGISSRVFRAGRVLPMYMGVILLRRHDHAAMDRAPHVYGGDPSEVSKANQRKECSPCIWG